ncbi:hypothetical protein GGD41_001821 [Paraburkholderia bryophila]|uniref:Uncharacterized protein n=1 Tax=Paraburkholderia bryophila TaxID=420952 RepID=A0A7Y9W6F4_9BURK|nr:hypothetical protein [Paraburkholderia bryophila]NYH27079.1 hypothetical protein [Paraburkholderia bryophila]
MSLISVEKQVGQQGKSNAEAARFTRLDRTILADPTHGVGRPGGTNETGPACGGARFLQAGTRAVRRAGRA